LRRLRERLDRLLPRASPELCAPELEERVDAARVDLARARERTRRLLRALDAAHRLEDRAAPEERVAAQRRDLELLHERLPPVVVVAADEVLGERRLDRVHGGDQALL